MKLRGFILSLGILLAASLLGATAASATDPVYYYPKTDTEMFKTVVKIMNSDESSGGTGAILSSDSSGSLLLTNKHVCRLVEGGGVVEDYNHVKHLVEAFKEDLRHDLCLVKIGADLGVSLKISTTTPDMGDEAVVAGHPYLLPTVVTRGHFSDHMIIHVNDGERNCTEDEKKAPETVLQCVIIGKMQTVVTREGQLITSLIMPGSSGSPVFNSSGEIAGVVFAGQGQLSFAIIVPLEYVNYFMKRQETQEWTFTP